LTAATSDIVIARGSAARDLLVVMAAIAIAWLVTKLWLYPALGIPENAPMILRPILGFAAAWAMLTIAGQRWADFGLRRPRSLLHLVIACAAFYAAVYLISTWLVPVLAKLFTVSSSPTFLAYIRGNTVAFIGWLAIAWLVGGFCEKLLFRGFLINRVESLVGAGLPGQAAGVLFQAVLFGALHLYQGSFGFVFAGTIALAYGIAYLLLGRNLWPLILVHGAWNSVGIARVYGL
jgi:membrane protease YdiL (CAAX protease family)